MKKYFFICLISIFVIPNNVNAGSNNYSEVTSSKKRKSLQGYVSKPKERIIYDKQRLLIVGTAYTQSQLSGYLLAGVLKEFGAYGKLKSDFNFNGDYTDEGESMYANRYFNGKSVNGRYSVTGGILIHLAKPTIFYGGLGFGSRWVNWETLSGEMYRVNDISFIGAEIEAGLIFKFNRILVSGGFSTIGFKYAELNLGLGVTF